EDRLELSDTKGAGQHLRVGLDSLQLGHEAIQARGQDVLLEHLGPVKVIPLRPPPFLILITTLPEPAGLKRNLIGFGNNHDNSLRSSLWNLDQPRIFIASRIRLVERCAYVWSAVQLVGSLLGV